MSDDILKLIPADPHFVPTEDAQKRAVTALEKMLPEGEECEAETYERVTFIDQGENVEAVVCPSCAARLELYDGPNADAVASWWTEISDRLDGADASAISVEMLCCGKTVPLTSLTFDWPAGFASFELSIWNPEIDQNLTAAQVSELERILGCSLLQVRAHY